MEYSVKINGLGKAALGCMVADAVYEYSFSVYADSDVEAMREVLDVAEHVREFVEQGYVHVYSPVYKGAEIVTLHI